MFAVMIDSSNEIVRILNTVGREGPLPRLFGFIDRRRLSPTRAVFVAGGFAIITARIVGAVSGGLGDPTGGSNVRGWSLR